MTGERMTLNEFRALSAEREKSFKKTHKKSAHKKPAKEGATPRKKPTQWEGAEQQALMVFLAGERQRKTILAPVHDAIYHVPNGGSRDYKTAKDMKAQGVKKGVSDLVLPIARGGYFGLYIEFKASRPHNAELHQNQLEWLSLVEREGYAATFAVGKEEAKEILVKYMSLPPTKFDPIATELGGTQWRDVDGKAKGR